MTLRKILAFTAVYIVWGSMYLAMKIGIESIPPLLLAALRSLIGGAVLYGWGRWRGGPAPTAAQWRTAVVVGSLFFLCAHGGLFWALQYVPSGVASLFVATIPMWMTACQYATEPGIRIGRRTIVGLIGGAVGIYLLVDPGSVLQGQRINPLAAAVLIGVALSWTLGSVVARRSTMRAMSVATGSYLLCGGTLLLLVSGLAGEWSVAASHSVSWRSVGGLAYLIVFGTVITFSAYNWLLRHTTLASLSTYAFVNPVVAVFLGWMFGGESISSRVWVAMTVILASVALSLSAQAGIRRPTKNRSDERTTPSGRATLR